MTPISLADISEFAWTKLAHAANDLTSPLRLMAVATVDENDQPGNRILAIRGADRESGRIWFHTDRAAPKVAQLLARPCICAIAYDHHDRVQIRVDGTVTLHEEDPVADHHWMQTTLAMKSAYTAAANSGHPPVDPRLQRMRCQDETGELGAARRNFLVIQVQVQTIEWYQACSPAPCRAILRAATGWQPEPIPS